MKRSQVLQFDLSDDKGSKMTGFVLLHVNLPSKVQYVLEMNVKKAICDAKLITNITVPRTKYALYCNNGQKS